MKITRKVKEELKIENFRKRITTENTDFWKAKCNSRILQYTGGEIWNAQNTYQLQ